MPNPVTPAATGTKGLKLAVAGALGLGLIIGYLGGRASVPAPSPAGSPPPAPLVNAPGEPAPPPEIAVREVKELSGTVVSIEGGVITLRVDAASLVGEAGPEERRVSVGASTEYFAYVRKDEAEYQKELEAYKATRTEETVPPSATELRKIALSDIDPEDRVLVAADQDIRMAASFSATRVVVLSVQGATAPAPPPGASAAPSGDAPPQPPPPPSR